MWGAIVALHARYPRQLEHLKHGWWDDEATDRDSLRPGRLARGDRRQGRDPREELAFHHQLADFAHTLRQQGGGVESTWQPGAPSERLGRMTVRNVRMVVCAVGGLYTMNESQSQLTLTLLKPTDVAAQLGVSRSWLYEAAKSGRIPSIRIGGEDGPLRFVPEDIQNWLDDARANWTPGRSTRTTRPAAELSSIAARRGQRARR